MNLPASGAAPVLADICAALRHQPAQLTAAERAALTRVNGLAHIYLHSANRQALDRLTTPIEQIGQVWAHDRASTSRQPWMAKQITVVRNVLLTGMHQQQRAFWDWDEETWTALVTAHREDNRKARLQLVAVGHLVGGHHRLHHRTGASHLTNIADLVFGVDAVQPAVQEVLSTIHKWEGSPKALREAMVPATVDVLLSCGSPRLEDVTDDKLRELVADNRTDGKNRRHGIFKLSRVLAAKGLISEPLTTNHHNRGPRPETLATVPPEWLEWATRWRKLSTHEAGTIRSMFSVILIAGRWSAEKHPEAVSPDRWTRDIAAEYVADTLHAVIGQWAGHNRNRARNGQELSAVGKAQRIDSIRGFFADLIEWEWITPRFDPRRVLSLPLSIRAGMGPNPRIIDDASWAKLMAAGLTITADDLDAYGTPAAQASGWHRNYYPIEMIRALVGVWLFAGLRVDEIRRLELDCVTWDQATDDTTGERFRMCLLRIPQNKTSGAFTKPVDPLVGELIEAWQAVRPPQPDIADRKTGRLRPHLFCFRAQLVGKSYLNEKLIPILCRKAGIPETDSRGALTSHRARATIATQLLNAREPLSLADLQQWLGHKHASSTRHYAAILQRTLTAAYRKADYFSRNVRTIQVLIDREAILTGTAADGGEPWKYYDLGDGYCSYDFFAKCPHRLACARCPFYVPKDSRRGQLLAVKDGIQQMLEQLDLTEEEREALEGDREAVAALIDRLADIPTPAGPTPAQLGAPQAFIPLTALTGGPASPAPSDPEQV
ncbi:tyrosine-type recombinase/integrase [Streptacidiphilus sp. MAP5-52]|uniref:tyrosine-type recombinase/integrase n=1 Tax=Streptacidiphilus sp. MAP5-52 TaxID=3156267 RepID=UPI0035162A6D